MNELDPCRFCPFAQKMEKANTEDLRGVQELAEVALSDDPIEHLERRTGRQNMSEEEKALFVRGLRQFVARQQDRCDERIDMRAKEQQLLSLQCEGPTRFAGRTTLGKYVTTYICSSAVHEPGRAIEPVYILRFE